MPKAKASATLKRITLKRTFKKPTRTISAKVMRKVNRKRPASGFEKAVHAVLAEEKILYVKEKTIGRIHVDLLIGQKNVVECQGCYFHGHTACQKNLSQMQLSAHEKDARRFAFLKRLGYQVHAIWECEFYKDPDVVRKLFKGIAG